MKSIICSLLIFLGGFGCARIYRPIEMAPARTAPESVGLTATLDLQPWGDNSRYEEKALRSNLRVLALGLGNFTDADIEVLGLDLPDSTSALSPAEALTLVKQKPLLYLSYPLMPGLMIPGAESKGSFGPSDQAVFSALAVIGLAIGIPNAVVAARSNTRLGAFFQDRAWVPIPLRPGQVQRGLIFLRSPDPYKPLVLQLHYRNASGEQRLELLCPGVRPL